MGSRGIALLFLYSLLWMGVGDQCHIPERDPVPIVQDAGLTPRPVWTGAENFAPLGFDPQTIQPIVSLCNNYAVMAHTNHKKR